MESEIVNYANEISPIMRKLLEDSYSYNLAIQNLGFQPPGEKPMESMVRLGQLGVNFAESIKRIKESRKQIMKIVPPADAKSHHAKLVLSTKKKEQALGEFVTYIYQLLKSGVGDSSFLQQGNDLLSENSRLLLEANSELTKLYKEVGK